MAPTVRTVVAVVGFLFIVGHAAPASAGVVTSGCTPAVEDASALQDGPIAITATDLPNEISPGTRYTVAVQLENGGDSSVTRTVQYVFDGGTVLTEEVTLESGVRDTVTFDVTLSRIESAVGQVTAGTYSNGIRVENGPTETERVTVASPTTRTNASTSASVSFAHEAVDRDDNGQEALGGVVATIREYGGAESVRIVYRLPEQGVTLYESDRYPVSKLRQAGPLGPEQADPDRKANQLMASHVEQQSDGPDREFKPQDGEHVVVKFYDADGTLVDEITYVVGQGKSHTLGSGTPVSAASADDSTSDTRQRGFFSNAGDGPTFLSNVFNLTVLGFLLSVAGILHQMLAGR